MNSDRDRILVANHQLEVRRSSARKTMEISVERSGQLVVRAPIAMSIDKIAELAEQKKVWILNHVAEKQILLKSVREREFVSGESFYYLGRPYRLRVVPDDSWTYKGRGLVLDEGRFHITKSDAKRARELFVAWYTEEARQWLADRVDGLAVRIGAKPSATVVRDLGYRWGSCTSKGLLQFHWQVITLPIRSIDYLIAHELTHLKIRSHGEDFWRSVRRVFPDYEAQKAWLAEHGAGHCL